MKVNKLIRNKPNIFAGRGSSNILDFNETVTSPNILSRMLRLVTYTPSNPSKTRPFNMYMEMMHHQTSKMDISGNLHYRYGRMAESIVRNFISSDLVFKIPTNIEYVRNKIRIDLYQELTQLTGCGAVNVIFKNGLISLDEGISMMIIDSRSINGQGMSYELNAQGIKFDKNATINIIIPLDFIKSIVRMYKMEAVSDVREKYGLDPNSHPNMVLDTINGKVHDRIGRLLNRSLFSALYKSIIFNQIESSIYTMANNILNINIKNIERYTFSQLYDKKQSDVKTFVNLSMRDLVDFIGGNDGDFNPNTLVDIYDIKSAEIDKCMSNLLNGDDQIGTIDVVLKFASLNLDSSMYSDTKSMVLANGLHIRILTAMVIFLSMVSLTSIRPSIRRNYITTVSHGINSVISILGSDITNSYKPLIDSISSGIKTLERLSRGQIKLSKLAGLE